MDSKKTTIVLSICLLVLLGLLFLRACGVQLPFGPKSKNNTSGVNNASGIAKEAPANKAVVTNSVKPPVSAGIAVSSPVVTAVFTPEVKEDIAEKPEEPKRTAVPKMKAAKPANAAVKSNNEVSKADLPQPAVQRPKREPSELPKYTNKSGFKPFYVYKGIGAKENHYSPYALMGNLSALNIDQGSKNNPHSGKTCIKVTYDTDKPGGGWAGVYWTEPPNNWGDKGLGFNLTGAERISFWARGEKGKETINNFIMGGINGRAVEDSDYVTMGPVVLTTGWKQYFIDIKDADLTNIIGGFCFTITKTDNPDGAVFYLDDIVYE